MLMENASRVYPKGMQSFNSTNWFKSLTEAMFAIYVRLCIAS
jgi:hypothetical protein